MIPIPKAAFKLLAEYFVDPNILLFLPARLFRESTISAAGG